MDRWASEDHELSGLDGHRHIANRLHTDPVVLVHLPQGLGANRGAAVSTLSSASVSVSVRAVTHRLYSSNFMASATSIRVARQAGYIDDRLPIARMKNRLWRI